MLDRNDVDDHIAAVRDLARSTLGREVDDQTPDARRLARAVLQGLRPEMLHAAEEFSRLATRRPAGVAVQVLEEGEIEGTPELLAALQRAKPGDNLQSLLDQLVFAAKTARADDRPLNSAHPVSSELRNADALFSTLWPLFTENKIVMKEWRSAEAKTNELTMRLWRECCGDRPPRDYSCDDASKFHRMMDKLPSAYYHSGSYRKIYEREGALAVVASSEGLKVPRLSAKTWNSHNSVLNQFFVWCAGKGQALPKGMESICQGEFVKIPKPKVRRHDDPSRIIFEDNHIRALFSAPKFMGAVSGHYWKRPGLLVVRDGTYIRA